MNETLADMLVRAYSRPKPTSRWQVGQRVRVRKTLTCNTYEVLELLGAIGVVQSIDISGFSHRIFYNIEFPNGRVEPFEECELDRRFVHGTESTP